MDSPKSERRLIAILAVDMVGYSRLMGEDEVRTLNAMADLRKELFDPVIEARGGRIVKRMGDGWFVELPNASDAVACAIDVQNGIADHEIIRLRIGIHIGDVTFREGDIYGDGVNVAARLEAFAEAGQVVISDTVHNSLDTVTGDLFGGGEVQKFKNIVRPVQVWRWPIGAQTNAPSPTGTRDTDQLPMKPSIAVLPFKNLSSDPEQEFFADGIVEDLITALSRFRWLFVIARNTSFSFKGQNTRARRIAQELAVRYVVEGSVRMSSTRLRVSVQLIDAVNDRNVWADNYDRPTGDLFDLQDEITQAITGVLVPELNSAERERSLRDNRPALDAWVAYQKGLAHYYLPYTEADHAEAKRQFDRSIELDANFADAHAMVSLMKSYAISQGQSSFASSIEDLLSQAKQTGAHAVQTDDDSALAHVALGRAYMMLGEFGPGVAEGNTAIKLNPNFALAYHELGFTLSHLGSLEESIRCFEQAIRLSPNDPSRWNFFLLKGVSQFGLGEYERAIANIEEASRLRPAAFWPFLALAATYVGMDRIVDARVAVGEVLTRKPEWTVTNMVRIFETARSDHMTKWVNNLRIAGLPEE